MAQGDTKKGLKKIADGVKELLKAEKEGADTGDLVDQLVEAARSQAQAAIDGAVASGGDPKKIAKAEKELSKAEEELAEGLTPDQAADLLLVATQGLRVIGATESKIRADSTIQTVLDTLTPTPPVRR